MSGKIICTRCNGSGEVALNAWTLAYKCAGPVPENARGVIEAECGECYGAGEVESKEDD